MHLNCYEMEIVVHWNVWRSSIGQAFATHWHFWWFPGWGWRPDEGPRPRSMTRSYRRSTSPSVCRRPRCTIWTNRTRIFGPWTCTFVGSLEMTQDSHWLDDDWRGKHTYTWSILRPSISIIELVSNWFGPFDDCCEYFRLRASKSKISCSCLAEQLTHSLLTTALNITINIITEIRWIVIIVRFFFLWCTSFTLQLWKFTLNTLFSLSDICGNGYSHFSHRFRHILHQLLHWLISPAYLSLLH